MNDGTSVSKVNPPFSCKPRSNVAAQQCMPQRTVARVRNNTTVLSRLLDEGSLLPMSHDGKPAVVRRVLSRKCCLQLPTATVGRVAAVVETSRLKTSAVDRTDDGLATIERLVAMTVVMASLDVNGGSALEVVTITSSVEAIVLDVPDGSAGHATDQTADGGTGDRSIATPSDQPTDDGSGDRSIASPALSKVLGLDVRYHHENGSDRERSVFDHVHCFDFRGRFFREDADE